VLGAVLLSDTALGIIAEERLRPEHFWTPLRREVFAAMLELSDAGHHVDQVTLKAKFAGSRRSAPAISSY
jgi:replicative DNA helicase